MTTQAFKAINTSILMAFTAVLGLGTPQQTRAAEELVLAVQPILDEEQTRKAFQPLCDYLAKAIGSRCSLYTVSHFYPYWEAVRAGKSFNLALDAAHFTDYRASKLGFEVLAKVPDSVSYTLVTHSSDTIFDAGELIGKRVATLGIPSIGAARLNGMFPNPSRQPQVVEVTDADEGVKLLVARKVNAAILPTPIVSQHMSQGAPLAVVTTTDPIPHIALSASPALNANTRNQLRQALVNAHRTEAGQAMLKQVGFAQFDPATSSVYANQAGTLQEYWGY